MSRDPLAVSRRELLRLLAYGGGGVALAGGLAACSGDGSEGDAAPAEGANQVPLDNGPILVVVELVGGNDGWSTVVPYESGRYRDLRPTLAVPGDEVLPLSDGWGLNQRLSRLAARGPAIISGIGAPDPVLSHFVMMERWWQGLPGGVDAAAPAEGVTAFLGRLCDQIRGDERFTGASLAFGAPPALRAERAATTGLPDTGFSAPRDETVVDALQQAYRRMAKGDVAGTEGARTGLARMLWMVDIMGDLPDPTDGFPDTSLGDRMALASRLVRSHNGLRVLHVPTDVLFDTHIDHGTLHPPLLEDIDQSLDAFLRDLDDAGIADRVLLTVTSEFGRRPQEHDGGLDHGAASALMAFGPVHAGERGEPSPLDRFDEHDNLIPTLHFDRYQASMAAFLGVDPADVLVGTAGAAPEPIAGLLRT